MTEILYLYSCVSRSCFAFCLNCRCPQGLLCLSVCALLLQGVVGGVLIVTPNNIMFDPHKSDPLVIEHGCEEYGLICPMEEVMSVALYDDVSRMKLKDALPS